MTEQPINLENMQKWAGTEIDPEDKPEGILQKDWDRLDGHERVKKLRTYYREKMAELLKNRPT